MSPNHPIRSENALRRFRTWLAGENYFHGKLLGSSVAGVLVIVLLAAVFLGVSYRTRHFDQLRDATLETMRLTGKVENDLTSLENSHRDFLLTGKRSFLDQFRMAHASLQTRVASLRSLVAKDSPEGAALGRFEENFLHWDDSYAAPELQARENAQDPTAIAAHNKGRSWLDAARASLGNFARIQANIFEQANSHAASQRLLQTGGFALLCVLAIAFLIASSWYSFTAFSRHLRKVASAEEQTHAIFESALDGIITVDESGLIQSMNPAAQKMFALTAREATGSNVGALIPQQLFGHDGAEVQPGMIMAVGQRQGYYPFPLEISLSQMNVDGARRFVLMLRDISERKRGEETLKHIGLGVSSATGKEFVKSLAQELSHALQSEYAFVVELHSKGDKLTSTLTLAEKGEIHSSGPFELYGSACGDVLVAGFRAYIGGARDRFPEDALLAGLGVDTFIAMPLVDHAGKPVGLMGVLDHRPLQDVSIIESTLQIFAARAAAEVERKRFEEDLNAEKERLAVTLRSIGDGFITTDNRGRILMLNNVAEDLTGWKQELAEGQALTEIFHLQHERTRRPLNDIIMGIVEHGNADALAGAAVIISLDGTERLIETNASPIRDQYNQKVGVVLVFRDVTERLRAEEERRKNEKLESLGIAAGGIAHDFNNLLTAILGNISIALMTADTAEPGTERLVAAKKASLRAQELAQQLLTFAKGGAPIKQTASIAQLVRDTVSFSLRGSNVRSDFNISEGLWPADVDAGQISQVIQNLAINADQAMPAGGTLHVDCGNLELSADNQRLGLKAGRYLRITVRDEGIGIPEDNLKKIFDPYFTTKPKGSGLGLATTYSIIKNHGGIVEVFSQPGEGTTFYIFLPASDKPLAVVKEASTPQQPIPTGHARILVLDDEDAICALVTCALEPLGYEVVEAYESIMAIKLYEDALRAGRRFDLVISDLTIPGSLSGTEALKRLREIDPTVRAIVSSGYAMDPIMADFRQYGFCGMIAKPYEIDTLGRTVAAVLAEGRTEENVIHLDFQPATATA